jgi:uncharacterized protein with PIN domain
MPAAPREIRSQVPAYVFDTHDQFHRCNKCNKVYWPGSHWDNIQQVIARLSDPQMESDDLPQDLYGK